MVHINNNEVTNYFVVDDLDLLLMLTQLNVREIEFVEIHFIDLGYVICGTFDCAMEVFFYDESKIHELELIASNYDLYLRKYNKWEDT